MKTIIRCLLAIILFSALVALKARDSRPNILLVLTDDVSPDMFSCYAPFTPKGFGHAANTPNVDKLAREGVLFKTCYATAMCLPSRVEIMTGRYANRTGAYKNGTYVYPGGSEYLEDHHGFGKLLRHAGYATAIAGKWHAGSIEPYEDVGGFEEYFLWDQIRMMKKCENYRGWNGGMEDANTTSRYWHPGITSNGKVIYTKPDDFGPELCAEFLMGFMERSVKAENPFLAYWPSVAPHGTRGGMPTNPLRGEVGSLNCDDPEERVARFKSLVEYMDLLMGRMVAKIEELGVADNTIIIFTSDNGTAITAKTRGVERGCHVVNIISGAGVNKRGPSDALTDFSDIAPTLVDLAEAEVPADYEFDGQSLVPFLTGERANHRDWIYGYIFSSQLLRTQSHLLEVVNPMMGLPEGRFCFTGPHRFRKGYVRAEELPEHQQARKKMLDVLRQYPPLTEDHPYWTTPIGKQRYEDNMRPSEMRKHIHNHPDWVYYSEN